MQTVEQHQHDAPVKGQNKFEAFISYSRDDIQFARLLEKTLKRFRPPAGLGVARHRIRVFRDESDLVGPVYIEAIREFLRQSRKLILICSPSARASSYVADEIKLFAKMHGARNIVPILLAGRPNNEVTVGEVDDRAFPDVLQDLLGEPLAAEYRGFTPEHHKPDKGSYNNAWYTLLANLYDVRRSEIEQRDIRRRRRERAIVVTVVSLVIASLATFGTIAWFQKLEAERQRRVALTGLAVNLADKSHTLMLKQPDMGLLVAIEAIRATADNDIQPIPEAVQALRDAVASTGGWALADGTEKLIGMGFDSQSETVFSLSEHQIHRWRVTGHTPEPIAISDPPSQLKAASPGDSVRSPSGRWHAVRTTGGATITDLHSAAVVGVATDTVGNPAKLAISDDGRWLAAGTSNGGILVRELPAGKDWQSVYSGHPSSQRSEIKRLEFGPGADLLYAAYADDMLRLWSMDNGFRLLARIKESDAKFDQVVISQNNRWIVLAGWRTPMRVYALDPAGAKPVPIDGDGIIARRVQFSSDERWLAAADDSGRTFLWNTNELGAAPVALGIPLENYTPTFAFSDDGSRFAAAAADGRILLWNTDRLRRRPDELAQYDARVGALVFSPNGQFLVSADNAGIVRIMPVENQDRRSIVLRHAGEVSELAISKDSQWLATRGRQSMRLWSIANPFAGSRMVQDVIAQPEIKLQRDRRGSMGGVFVDSRSKSSKELYVGLPDAATFSSDGKWFATIGKDDTVLLVDRTKPAQAVRKLSGLKGGVTALTFDPEGRWLAAGGFDRNLLVWEVGRFDGPRLRLKRTQSAGESSVIRLTFSPDGRWLAMGGGFGEAAMWDWQPINDVLANTDSSATGELGRVPAARSLDGLQDLVVSVNFSGDSTRLVTAGKDVALVWTTRDPGAPPIRVEINTGHFLANFASDSSTLVTAGEDAIARIWNLDQTTLKATELRGHEAAILNLAVDAQSRWLATAGIDGRVLLWDLKGDTTVPAHELEHPAPVAALGFGKAQRLFTAGRDGIVRLWNLNNLTAPPITLKGHQGPLWWVGEDPAGRALASLGKDGIARLWPMQMEQLVRIACSTAGTNLTYHRWRDALGEKPYAKTCEQFRPHPSLVEEARRLAHKGRVDLAVELFSRAVELEPDRELNPDREARNIAVAAMIDRGKRLARKGMISAASVQFEKAKTLQPDAVSDPWVMANKFAAAKALHAEGLELAKAGRYKAAVAKFITAKGVDPEIDVDPVGKARELVVPVLLRRADDVARDGNLQRATEMFHEILALDPEQRFDPTVRAAQQAAKGYRLKGERQAKRGDIEDAIESLRRALELDPTLDIVPQAIAYQLGASALVRSALNAVRDGRVTQGMEQLQLALRSDPKLEVTAECWARLCWFGGLWNQPQNVAAACEKAVALEPDNGSFRDNRGLVRALSGNFAGAIDDFRAYVEWAPNNKRKPEQIVQRQTWIRTMNDGTNPFTAELLERLRQTEKNRIWVDRCTR